MIFLSKKTIIAKDIFDKKVTATCTSTANTSIATVIALEFLKAKTIFTSRKARSGPV